MFESLRKLLFGSEAGASQALALDLEISVRSDGFVLKNKGSQVQNGSPLLITYTLDGEKWQQTRINFQEEPEGCFVYTGQRPKGVVVMLGGKTAHSNYSSLRRTTYQAASQDRWEDDFVYSDSFFNPMNPLSPFYGASFGSPVGLFNLFSHQDRDEVPPEDLQVNDVSPPAEAVRDEYAGGCLPHAQVCSDDPYNTQSVTAEAPDPKAEEGYGAEAKREEDKGFGESEEGGGIEAEASTFDEGTSGLDSEPNAY